MVEKSKEAKVEQQVLFTARGLYYNGHYGRLITNTSDDENMIFTVKFTEMRNLELEGQGNVARGKVGPGQSFFMMLTPTVTHGKVGCKFRTHIDFATELSAARTHHS